MTNSIWKVLPVAALLLMVISGTGCKTTSASGKSGKGKTDVPADVAAAFKEDAARLAVREVNSSKTSSGELDGTIPQTIIDKYYTHLCAIYLLAKTIDTIPDLGTIHTIRRPDLRRIRLVLEPDAPFIENWSKGYTLTDDLYLNQIIGKYKMKIVDYKAGGAGPTVILESPTYINTTEVAFLISHVTGIRQSEADGVAGDGDNIESGADGKNAFAIKFSQGRGDCPSGCIYRKYWVFYVNPDNTVQFVGTRGAIPNE